MYFYIKILIHNCLISTTYISNAKSPWIYTVTLLAFFISLFCFQIEMDLNKAASSGNFKSFNLFANRGNLEYVSDCSIESVYPFPSLSHPITSIYALFKGEWFETLFMILMETCSDSWNSPSPLTKQHHLPLSLCYSHFNNEFKSESLVCCPPHQQSIDA